MKSYYKLFPVGLLALLSIACCFNYKLVEAGNGPNQLKDFKELLAAATQLESAAMLLTNDQKNSAQDANKREILLFQFARESKGSHCKRQYESFERVAVDFRAKGYEFLNDIRTNGNNWFNNFIKFGGPIFSMKNMGKFDIYLSKVAERYDSQAKSKGNLTELDIDCDIIKFKIRQLHSLLFILQTDIKYLVIENQPVLNAAIYDKLKADKFKTVHNFYEIHELSQLQRDLLLLYLSERVDVESKTVGEAKDHYINPGEFIIGRLLESCQSMLQYESPIKDLEAGHGQVCPHSTSDPENGLFLSNYKLGKFDETFTFCERLFKAL